ncbi:unnamed protein product, partial [Eretmochelys imbricata]
PECAQSSPTTYFWYRKALDVSGSISASGGGEPGPGRLPAGCLGPGLRRPHPGHQVLRQGAVFQLPLSPTWCCSASWCGGCCWTGRPTVSASCSPPSWQSGATCRSGARAATQVFFSLGLGFGERHRLLQLQRPVQQLPCRRAAGGGINFLTSLLATLVVFAVLGFRATAVARACVA